MSVILVSVALGITPTTPQLGGCLSRPRMSVVFVAMVVAVISNIAPMINKDTNRPGQSLYSGRHFRRSFGDFIGNFIHNTRNDVTQG